MEGFEVAATASRLAGQGGGYEVVHASPGLEIGVYVLVAPEEDKQVPHALDEVYVVLDGDGRLDLAVPNYGYLGLEEDVVMTEHGAEYFTEPQREIVLIKG